MSEAPATIESIVRTNRAIGSGVKYVLYNGESLRPTSSDFFNQARLDTTKGQVFSNICFRDMWTQFDPKMTNRIAYYPDNKLNEVETRKWLSLCVEHKLLPANIDPQMDLTKGFVLDATVPLYLLYVYLCNLRHMSEEPDLLTAVIFMVEKENVDVHAALHLASRTLVRNTNHNYLPANHDAVNLHQSRVGFHEVYAFKRFMQNPEKYEAGTFVGCVPIRTAVAEMPEDLKHMFSYKGYQQFSIKLALADDNVVRAAGRVKKYKERLAKRKKANESTNAAVGDASALGARKCA